MSVMQSIYTYCLFVNYCSTICYTDRSCKSAREHSQHMESRDKKLQSSKVGNVILKSCASRCLFPFLFKNTFYIFILYVAKMIESFVQGYQLRMFGLLASHISNLQSHRRFHVLGSFLLTIRIAWIPFVRVFSCQILVL